MHMTHLPAFCTIISPVHCPHPCPSQSPGFSWSLFATKGSSPALRTSLPGSWDTASLQPALGPSSSPFLYVSAHFFPEPSWRINPHGKPYLSLRAELKAVSLGKSLTSPCCTELSPCCHVTSMWQLSHDSFLLFCQLSQWKNFWSFVRLFDILSFSKWYEVETPPHPVIYHTLSENLCLTNSVGKNWVWWHALLIHHLGCWDRGIALTMRSSAIVLIVSLPRARTT